MAGTVHRLACTIAERWTRINRAPVTILLFIPFCLAFIAIGWACDSVELFLLILTTALSIDASLEGRLVLLKQGQATGEVA